MKVVCFDCKYAKPKTVNSCYCVKYGTHIRYYKTYCVSYERFKDEQVRSEKDDNRRDKV